MADIKCPMCGRPNPAEAVNCSFCQARLKPPGWQPADESTEWLKDLQADVSTSLPESSKEQGEEPSWLSELRSGQSQEEDISGGETEAPVEGLVPDWIRELPPQETTLSPQNEPENESDWMSGLRQFEQPASPGSNEFSESPEGKEIPESSTKDDNDDWTERLAAWQSLSEEKTGDIEKGSTYARFIEPAGGQTPPDINLSLSFEDGEGESHLQADEDLPDWLGSLPPLTDDVSAKGLQPEILPSAEGELPAWLGEVSPPDSSSSDQTQVSGLPDWLNDFSVESEERLPQPVGEKPEVTLPLSPEKESGEWVAPPSTAADSDQAISADLPEWLTGMTPEEPPPNITGKDETATINQQTIAGEQIPDWLGGAEAEETTPEPQMLQSPEWLQPLPFEKEEKPEDFSLLQEQPQVGIFGRLAQEQDEEKEKQVIEEEPLQAAPKTSSTVMPFKEEDMPDWLSGPVKEPDQSAAPYTSPFKADNLPDWLSGFSEAAPPAEQAQAESEPEQATGRSGGFPFVEEGLPDWFEEEKEEESPASVGEPSPALAAGELPTWVSAMRPVEAISLAADEKVDDRKVESTGPLAGLRSILSAEDAALQFNKPPVYSFKLQVNEKQRVQASLLETMLETETRPAAERASQPKNTWRLVRMILGALLLLMVAVPLFMAPMGTGEPSVRISGEVQAAYAMIDQLPSDALVLVGLDFRAGYSRELNLAASDVLTRLMQKQTRLVMVATDPTVPVLGDRMVSESTDSGLLSAALAQEYKNQTRVVNLGYLPGGTASLQEFVQNPRQAASFGLLTPVNGILPWNTPILVNIDNLDQFGMVVVITDQAESGQAWIEQVQPALGSIPLVMVTSAQAAPLLEPYYQSGQVQGFISGLTGGTAFAILSGAGNEKSSIWNAYQSGLIFSALALVAGALFYGIAAMLEKGKGVRA